MSGPARITIGVDPGLSTGVAVLHDSHRVLVFQGSPQEALRVLDTVLDVPPRDGGPRDDVILAYERFTTMPGAVRTSQPEAQQVVGAVKNLATDRVRLLVPQSPGDARGIASNAFLHRSGLWVSPTDVGCPDANDANMAMRHAVLALATHRATLFAGMYAAISLD